MTKLDNILGGVNQLKKLKNNLKKGQKMSYMEVGAITGFLTDSYVVDFGKKVNVTDLCNIKKLNKITMDNLTVVNLTDGELIIPMQDKKLTGICNQLNINLNSVIDNITTVYNNNLITIVNLDNGEYFIKFNF